LASGKTKSDAETDVGKLAMAVSDQARIKKKMKIEAAQKKKELEKMEMAMKVAEEAEDAEDSEENEENDGRELPNIHTDGKLANIVDKAQKAEKLKESESKAFLAISSPALDLDQVESDEGLKKPLRSKEGKNRGVIYISHIPHGFYENAMRKFFGQFGSVTNLRLARSKKTGKSCGFAFVEFKYKEVATVVAETMNNYLMFDRLLKCSLVPKERVSRAIFRGKIKESRPPAMAARMKAKKLHNAAKCDETIKKRQVRQVKNVKKRLAKLHKAGIQYDFKIAEMSAPAK